MLADLLKNPDFSEFFADIDLMIEAYRVALEGTKDWEETVRAQGALAALRTVKELPQTKVNAAARKQRREQHAN